MTRFLKRCGAVLILFVVGSTCVLATPSATRTYSPSGASASGGSQFTAFYDDSNVTAVEVIGSLTYYSGATKTGWGTASDVMNCSFTITGVPAQPDGTDGGLWAVGCGTCTWTARWKSRSRLKTTNLARAAIILKPTPISRVTALTRRVIIPQAAVSTFRMKTLSRSRISIFRVALSSTRTVFRCNTVSSPADKSEPAARK